MSKALLGFLINSLLESERRIDDGVLERAQSESLNFPPTHPTEFIMGSLPQGYIATSAC
jgi:hypothetical protein